MDMWDVWDGVCDGLQEMLQESGFDRDAAARHFVKRIPAGKQIIAPRLSGPAPVRVSLTVANRLNTVQDILNKFSRTPVEYHAIKVTTVTELSWFTGKWFTKEAGIGYTYRVANEAELEYAIRALLPIIQYKIIPFLQRHKDIPAWDAAVNSPQNDICGDGTSFDKCKVVDSSYHPYRGMTAITLAHLAGNPSFEQIVAKLLRYYHESNQTAGEFTSLANHLRTRKL